MLLYIDPGTGSMLFTILIGIVGFLVYLFKVFWIKLKFLFTSGKQSKLEGNKIPYLIFAEVKRYWEVFKPICDEFEKRGIDVVYWTSSPDDPALKQEYKHVKFEFVGEGNKAFAKLNLVNASVVIATTPGLEVYQWKRSKFADHYIHILHMPNDVASYRMFGTDYFDSVLLSGEYQIDQIRELEEKRNLPSKDLALTGIPYMDSLMQKAKSAQKIESDKTTVLLAPSWGESAIFSRYGSKVIEELVKTGYNIIIRPHPQTFVSEKDMIEKIMKEYPDNDQIRWDRNPDNFDSLNRADILISDFSGVFFDFALVFDKPIIYADTSFDPICYDYSWLDEEPWTYSILPYLGKQLTADNMSDIKSVIDDCLNDNKYKEGRDKARAETWVNIGHGAEKTVDFIVNKYNEINKKEEKADKKDKKDNKSGKKTKSESRA